ncbi:Protein N-acetyltransferase, RimJ/RimL family [Rhizobium sp. NFR07]|uniref:GNAT family N-acetyltransferase n=1 Tax=Rhizobium sp. NFR07 TaxID=1566262 RepID=UPI0008E5E741|nr:GNAT family N-acetyltransferase [Rhizobium sp. NFR07]SFB42328.1 Protein N-acetyltransferase, RimJ/RimL family [Rhizobium sp. NFR07]
MATILETNRLRLETWGEDGVAELIKLHGSEAVMRFLDARGEFYDRTKAEHRLGEWAREYAEHGLGKQRLVRKDDGVFIGRAGFSLYAPGKPEIGYSLLPMHWGQGYATEIAEGLRDWLEATGRWAGFIGFAHVDNCASKRVLERIGMDATHQALVSEMPMQFYALEFARRTQ